MVQIAHNNFIELQEDFHSTVGTTHDDLVHHIASEWQKLQVALSKKLRNASVLHSAS